VGVVLSQSPEYVAPHGSSQALFGTNPIAVRLTSRPISWQLASPCPACQALSAR